MVHGFAAQSGGALRIESLPGAGILVEIILPRAALTGVAARSGLDNAVLDAMLHSGATILLVEDDEQVRPMTAGFLRELGYDVIEAANADAALALVNTLDTLGLVVTDVVVPGANGLTLAARLRTERPGLPVLFVSGHASGAELAGEAVLSKPFSGTELAAAVLERLGRLPPPRPTRASAERLLARLRDPTLRNLFLAWCDARLGGGLPRSGSVNPAEFGLGDHAFIVEVDNDRTPPAMRFIMFGPALAVRLGRTLDGQFTASEYGGDDVLGALDAAYGRCVRLLLPVHQSARYDFGDDAPVFFERLVLPFSEDGRTVTHLLGVALFEGETSQPAWKGCHDL